MAQPDAPSRTTRRDFLVKAAALAIGAVTVLVPAVSGLLVLLSPLRRKSAAAAAIRVASLEALPADGQPRKFPVLATLVDAWNRTPDVPVGAVYLRRTGEREVTALNVVCPHAGCFVDFRPGLDHYVCPCHNSTFALSGKILDPRSPAPRGMDALPVEIRADGGIWVTFENFRAGVRERVPV